MAQLTQQELLQPSLLDRLTDDDVEKQEESRNKRILSPARLRECVRRDLAWLLNTTNLTSAEAEVLDLPFVARSVLNYGIPDFSGRTASGIDIRVFERLLRTAILDFEPRLLRESVKVSLVADDREMSHNAMTFTIEAMLWAQPLPLRLFFRTAIDLEAGHVEVAEVAKP